MQENQTNNNVGLLQMYGLHPLVALGIIAVDAMLFAGAVATAGVGWVVSIPVAAVLALATIFIQKNAYQDDWVLAGGKGLIVGLLTAIPTPLPSIITASSGTLGAVSLIKNRKRISN